jgi:hypothetical protein
MSADDALSSVIEGSLRQYIGRKIDTSLYLEITDTLMGIGMRNIVCDELCNPVEETSKGRVTAHFLKPDGSQYSVSIAPRSIGN